MTVPFTFATSTNPIPLSNLDANFAAVGDSTNITYTPPFTGGVAETLSAKLAQTISVQDFGAVGDGVTDDASAIQNALNYATTIFGTVILPAGTYRVSTGITVPAGVILQGVGGNGWNGTQIAGGSTILADASVAIVVTLNGGAASVSTGINDVFIIRNVTLPSQIPSGSIGLKVISTDQASINNVYSFCHAIGIYVNGQLGMNFYGCNTGSVTDTHVLIENSYEVTFIECRFGRNGGGDYSSNNYIRIKGTDDTISFVRCQLNQTGNTVTGPAVYFQSYASPNGIVTFTTCHAESFASHFVYEDGVGSGVLRRLEIINSTIYTSSDSTVFIQYAAGFLTELNISSSSLVGAITLDQDFAWNICNNFIIGAVLINQGSGSFTGNSLYTGLTVQGVFTDSAVVSNNALITNTSYTNSATGAITSTGNITSSSLVNSNIINKFNTGWLQLTDVPFAIKTYYGSLDASGNVLISYSQSEGYILNVQGFYKGNSGEAKQLTFSYADGNGIVLTGGIAHSHYRVTVIHTSTFDTNW